ncbi:hypothetical protein QFZ45_000519 [Pseudomonas synxantha]|nr:hypothetical protein [Pseudomonas synxantha]
MPLKDTNCRNAKPQNKPYRLYDEQGLYLEVQPNGGRYWRLKYRFLGKSAWRLVFILRSACRRPGASVMTLVFSLPAAKTLRCNGVWPRWSASLITSTPLSRLPRSG